MSYRPAYPDAIVGEAVDAADEAGCDDGGEAEPGDAADYASRDYGGHDVVGGTVACAHHPNGASHTPAATNARESSQALSAPACIGSHLSNA